MGVAAVFGGAVHGSLRGRQKLPAVPSAAPSTATLPFGSPSLGQGALATAAADTSRCTF
eukprot:CAMPEP_0171113374 /NCGR_PEP_ID=MMETSP0766_2-20121228/82145_1 /TAXON_ID=439317 /ORGANISM="Gambierdiscus australes, Strain CAWD 149" /LENGTH=58 /DNA_ID=CAMNT_0011575571 /DNA_START=151 /DNA_END=324 /DNA_ORIENTATION=+